ncbi:MAG: PDZ domain-containing protein [Gemmataceae bacterium]|nr:PDZ domain-containing protein [Gemmataceae bacterium]
MTRIEGSDLSLFEFDLDLTWAGFFLSADGRMYGRYGSRNARSADALQSLAGLRHALEAALRTHAEAAGKPAPPAPERPPIYAERLRAAAGRRGGGCMHCHQVKEVRWDVARRNGSWDRDTVWVYPLPENVGLTLEIDRGNQVHSVAPGSAADKAGIRAGDTLVSLNDTPVASIADAQHGLHHAPAQGQIAVVWQQGEQTRTGKLTLAGGWRRTNIAWRPSMMDLLPSLSAYGTDLTAAEKKQLGLTEDRLAFRQEKPVHSTLRKIGLLDGDVIVGIDGQTFEMDMDEFLAHVRRNFLIGDKVILNIFRNGKRMDLPLTLS